MKDSISIKTQLDKPLLTKAVKAILSDNVFVKYSWIIGIILILFSVILFVYVFQGQSYAPSIGLFCGTFLLFFKNIMAFFSVQKLGPSDMAYETLTYTFNKQDIDLKGETFTAKLHWENIKKVVETSDFFLIYQKTLAANTIPKKSITVEQLNEFRNFLLTIEDIEVDIFED